MRPEARKYLYDIQRAAGLLEEFTAGKSFADYEQDPMLRAAVEREFGIVGEATARLARADAATAGRIDGYEPFRNILVHGYAEVDDRLVWDILRTNLPALAREVAALLEPE